MDQSLKVGFIPIEGSSGHPEFLEEVLLGDEYKLDCLANSH